MTTNDLPLFVIAERDRAMKQVATNAGPTFAARAMRFVVDYLHRHGESSGEDITDACVEAGIVPHDARAFGPVMKALMRDGLIEPCGFCLRKKGHGTAGGRVWRLRK